MSDSFESSEQVENACRVEESDQKNKPTARTAKTPPAPQTRF